MNTFANALENYNYNATAYTTNGMKAYTDTSNAVLDLFGAIGSSRGKDLSRQFAAAMAEDAYLTMRVLMWARDVRGGAGERQMFRDLLQELEKTSIDLARKLVCKCPWIVTGKHAL